MIEALRSKQSKVEEDPFQLGLESLPIDVLYDHQKEAVAEGIKVQRDD